MLEHLFFSLFPRVRTSLKSLNSLLLEHIYSISGNLEMVEKRIILVSSLQVFIRFASKQTELKEESAENIAASQRSDSICKV